MYIVGSEAKLSGASDYMSLEIGHSDAYIASSNTLTQATKLHANEQKHSIYIYYLLVFSNLFFLKLKNLSFYDIT